MGKTINRPDIETGYIERIINSLVTDIDTNLQKLDGNLQLKLGRNHFNILNN